MLNQRFLFPVVFVFVLAFALSARAGTDTDSFAYVAPETLPPMLLPAPPAEGSAAWRQEIAAVIAAQAQIPPADHAAMRDEQHLHLELMTTVIGDDFTRERFPKTFDFLDRVLDDGRRVTEADKKYWHTRRPYLTDHHIRLLVDRIDTSFAYPSGHASETRVIAEVLGMLYPQRLDALRARADAITQRRVEAGVHYPVDIRGGETLASMIIGALMQSDDFQDDLTLAREEIAAAQ